MTAYDTLDVPVRGGDLLVGRWASGDVAAGATPTTVVLAAHGVTANHAAWWPVARRLTAAREGVLVLAPDLRGRGGSGGLPDPWGMATHVEDLAAVLDAVRPARAVVVGHSMGGFVAAAFAATHPDRLARLVLVDGGVPFPLPSGTTPAEATAAVLGPALARLSMRFDDLGAYRDFFRAHPAIGPLWDEDVERYVDHDFADGRSSVRADAVAEDSAQLYEDGPVTAAWARLAGPVAFLRAPGGMLGAPPGLYPPDVLARWAATHPALEVRDVDGVDHYSIVLGPVGAAAVAAVVDP